MRLPRKEPDRGSAARLTEAFGWRRADRGWMGRDLVDAGEGLHPPLVGLLVDLALAHEEARVQPAVVLVLGEELQAHEDRPAHAARRVLLDALSVHRDEDLGAVVGGDDAAEVRRPDPVLAPPGEVGPAGRSPEYVARHRSLALPEADGLGFPERPGPGPLRVAHRQKEQRFESHDLRPPCAAGPYGAAPAALRDGGPS